jgi:GT2 family glycosyltransferase
MSARLIAGAAGPPDGPYDADIIILALERAEETLAAIASASSQIDVSLHIFVLDQGSCPATLQRLAAAANGRSNLTLLAGEQNLGVAGGRNLISNLGHGRVIVGLDNDAEFATSDTVARMVAVLDGEPRLGAIGCRIVSHANGCDDLSSWGYPVNLLPFAGACFDVVTYVGAGHAIMRKAWQQAGGYDSRLFFCWEEFDFCLRAIALGWCIRYRGDIVIRHKVSAEQRIGRKLDQGWLTLAPRAIGYGLKGLRNGLFLQTLRAFLAAAEMAPRAVTRRMTPAGIAYLTRNDRAHRGSFFQRCTREIFSRVGGASSAVSAAER